MNLDVNVLRCRSSTISICIRKSPNLIAYHWYPQIFISLYIISFVTYQGASTIIRRTLDWNLWIVLIFDTDAVPHNCMPYNHTGLSIALYINNLFSRLNWDLWPISQYIFWSCNPSCFHLVSICFDQVRRHPSACPDI